MVRSISHQKKIKASLILICCAAYNGIRQVAKSIGLFFHIPYGSRLHGCIRIFCQLPAMGNTIHISVFIICPLSSGTDACLLLIDHDPWHRISPGHVSDKIRPFHILLGSQLIPQSHQLLTVADLPAAEGYFPIDLFRPINVWQKSHPQQNKCHDPGIPALCPFSSHCLLPPVFLIFATLSAAWMNTAFPIPLSRVFHSPTLSEDFRPLSISRKHPHSTRPESFQSIQELPLFHPNFH